MNYKNTRSISLIYFVVYYGNAFAKLLFSKLSSSQILDPIIYLSNNINHLYYLKYNYKKIIRKKKIPMMLK
jgi:hypothetical protein